MTTWTIAAVAFVAAVLLWLALCYGMLCAASDADDDADEYGERFIWSDK